MGAHILVQPRSDVGVGAESFDEAQIRRWLMLLRRPDQLGTADVAPLLQAHGRLPDNPSPVAMGQAAAELIREAIGRLKPPEEATREEALPYRILELCFLQGAKVFQAAGRLGISERQMSRERSRAIRLLKSTLEAPVSVRDPGYQGEPIPAIRGFVPRAAEMRKLEKALGTHRLLNVHGAPGIGKTSLVAEIASAVPSTVSVMWQRFRAGVNVSLVAVLFELGEYLSQRGHTELADVMARGLPDVEPGLATRLALKGLTEGRHLLVFDDFHLVEEDLAILGFFDEITTRVEGVHMITVSRRRYMGRPLGTAVEVGPLAPGETKTLLTKLGIQPVDAMLKALHEWTRGNPHLLHLAASWLKTASEDEVQRGVESLRDQAEVQRFLLDSITGLIDTDDRAVLKGASIFRHRFSDDALAFVTGRTRGAVMDSSLRLVRAYVAARSRKGDSAFFHQSVRQYVYERLDDRERQELHERAAEWYRKHGSATETAWHSKKAAEAETAQEDEGRFSPEAGDRHAVGERI